MLLTNRLFGGKTHILHKYKHSALGMASNFVRSVATTPMMLQYNEAKKQHPDHILFFRMGDFYEIFHEDAIHASSILGIALTKRGKTGGNAIPMCGVPHRSLEAYVKRLLAKGHKVAVCDQGTPPTPPAHVMPSHTHINRSFFKWSPLRMPVNANPL